MLCRVTTDLLPTLESYYDAAPRANASAEEVGPFTLFVRVDPVGWPYYARPRLGLDRAVDAADVTAVRARQVELGVPETLEWVHETTPSLLDAAAGAGLVVRQLPLLVWSGQSIARSGHVTTRILEADDPDLPAVLGAVGAGFAGKDVVEPRASERVAANIRKGLTTLAGAFDENGVVGGGSHAPRGDVTELTGIAVLPRARRRGTGAAIALALAVEARDRGVGTVFLSARDDAVARVYERVGFIRTATACIAETPDAEGLA